MGWGEGSRRADLHVAAATSAGQLPAAGLLRWVVATSGADDHGAGYGGAFGPVRVLLLAPRDTASPWDPVVCGGPGARRLVEEGDDVRRDEVRVRFDGNCGQETAWTIGGTADAPEPFVTLGDPDAGDLRILTRD
ncbi:hypothetical protein GCM10019016_069510 [Streptomyces prasinosporus]|uniref:Uncharacterized protein n=1 Tax=Streptomyces prasinosporus TaxID=68256 RepID=A0ABP6TZV7_9ACTN